MRPLTREEQLELDYLVNKVGVNDANLFRFLGLVKRSLATQFRRTA